MHQGDRRPSNPERVGHRRQGRFRCPTIDGTGGDAHLQAPVHLAGDTGMGRTRSHPDGNAQHLPTIARP